MDIVNYYVTTLTNAAKILGPYLLFLVGGYLLFVKLPFLFLKTSFDNQKKKLEEENNPKGIETPSKPYTVDDYKDFQRRLKLMNGPQEAKKKEEPRKEEKKKEEPKKEIKKPAPVSAPSPEEVLGLKPNEPFTKAELKKRYFELLKQNHPDRVASLGPDFKALAEKNTKEINRAYDKLKNRAA